MQEMLAPTSRLTARDWANRWALITDGRFAGGTWGMVVATLRRKPTIGGRDCADQGRRLDYYRREKAPDPAQRHGKELAARRKKWKAPKPRYTRGLLAKYMKLVSTASPGRDY